MHITEWEKVLGDAGVCYQEALMSFRDGCNPVLRLRVIYKSDDKYEPVVRDHGLPGVMVASGDEVKDLTEAKAICIRLAKTFIVSDGLGIMADSIMADSTTPSNLRYCSLIKVGGLWV